MKMLICLLLMCIVSTSADELKVNKLYTEGQVEIDPSSLVNPVLKMIEAFKKGNVENAKEFCTDEFINYADKSYSKKFAGEGLFLFKETFETKKPLKFKFFAEKNGMTKVFIAFRTKDQSTSTESYYVQKINDTWLIVAPPKK